MRRAIAYTSGTQLIIQAIGLGTGIIVARALGPGGRGQVAAVISWVSMMAYVGNFGMPVALAYAAARYPAQRPQLLGNSAAMAIVQWLLLGLVGSLILPRALPGQGERVIRLALLYLWTYVPLNLLTLYANSIQRGAGRYGAFNLVRMSVPVGYVAALGTLWLTGVLTVSSVVVASIASNLFALVLALATALPWLLKVRREAQGAWLSRDAARRDLRYGLTAQIGALQPFTGMRLDVLALTIFVGSQQVGLYVAALAAANVLRAQGFALGQVALPEVARLRRQKEQWWAIRRFAMLAAAGGAVAAVIVFVVGGALLRIVYGAAFAPAAPILNVLTVAGGVAAVYRVVADGLRGMGRPGVSTAAELAGLVIGLPLLILFGAHFGGVGAAFAVLVVSVVSLGAALAMGLGISRKGQPPSFDSDPTREANL